jgi:crossover junction endodeoxyribonuclease RusA
MSKQHPGKNVVLLLVLPIPPSINEQYATVNGHRVSTAAARRFKQRVGRALAELERKGVLHEELRERLRQGYLSFYMAFYFEMPLKRDLDGGLKITQFSRVEALSDHANPDGIWPHCV